MAVLAAASEPSHVARSYEVVPDWRRIDDEGYAVRLSPTQTFQPSHVTGRWRAVDTNLPYAGWRSSRRASGAGLWVVLVALFGWLGWSKGRGPLAELASYREREDDSGDPWVGDLPGDHETWGPGAAQEAEEARLPPLFEGHHPAAS